MSLEELAVRAIVCPRCEAGLGEGCKTIGGHRSTRNHSARTEPLYAAWRNGYNEGLKDARE